MANTPTLTVNGFELPFWSQVQINRTIEALADTFSVSYNLHEQTPGGDVNPISFDGDEPVVIALDGEALLTGYIDHAECEFSADGGTVEFSGYSRTADLVACPVIPRPVRFADKSIEDIVRSLCQPFELEVEVDPSVSADAAVVLEVFKAAYGETVHEALARAATYRGLLLMPTPEGKMLLTRAGSHKVSTVLRLGGNLKRVRVVRDARDRFSHYYVTSPDAGHFDPDNTGKEGKVSLARDPGVGRYRPTVLHAEQDVRTQARRLAQGEWERARRAGDSLRISGEFPQWRHADGLWAPSDMVRVEINKAGLSITREMVIATVNFSRDQSSATVHLELVHPDSLAPRAVPLPRRRKARQQTTEFPNAPEVELFEDTGFKSVYGEDAELNDTEVDPFE